MQHISSVAIDVCACVCVCVSTTWLTVRETFSHLENSSIYRHPSLCTCYSGPLPACQPSATEPLITRLCRRTETAALQNTDRSVTQKPNTPVTYWLIACWQVLSFILNSSLDDVALFTISHTKPLTCSKTTTLVILMKPVKYIFSARC